MTACPIVTAELVILGEVSRVLEAVVYFTANVVMCVQMCVQHTV